MFCSFFWLFWWCVREETVDTYLYFLWLLCVGCQGGWVENFYVHEPSIKPLFLVTSCLSAEQAWHLPGLWAQAIAPGAASLYRLTDGCPLHKEKLTLGSSQISKVPSLNSAMANEPSFYFFFTGHTSWNAQLPQPGMEPMARLPGGEVR